ncbi:acyl-CoA thioesterase [Nocardia huaxiensis]|uniref:Acyl-CoA thioesterase n=1 Tax=Nocardia huaxiensis TaxID=2755382 RepID=A0A7D6Z7C5_9NOCA|nr:acyl-CoA thioesterase [Nocardia huaxiensis]QLY28688.1 acyl-CoA thioesterase [Nocardia huaxiensis]UFS97838.1 acyl-CoA thioesterase [Nocardia huaxiensis]
MVFSVPITVRGYELDINGHLNQAVYHQYAEHARWELMRAAGVPGEKMIASGIGPVVLESNIKYFRELHLGDEVTVSCTFEWTGRKVFTMHQEIVKLDGTVSAQVTVVAGVMDLKARKLVSDPRERFLALAESPEVLGL